MYTDRPCGLYAFDVAADGTVFTGGGHYGPVSFAGQSYPKRAYESLLLGAVDRKGRGLWSISLGTQWHNNVTDLRLSGDTVFLTGIHANGFQWGSERLLEKQVAVKMAFNAEHGFLAAARTDGTLLWLRSLELLATGSETPSAAERWDPGLVSSLRQHLEPDGKGGVWVLAHKSTPVLLHVGADGNVLEKRELLLGGDQPTPNDKPVHIAADGTLQFVVDAKDDAPARLVRIDPKGGRIDAELPKATYYPSLLAVGPKGDAYVVLPVGPIESQGPSSSGVKAHHVAYYANPTDTAPRWSKSLYDSIRLQGLKNLETNNITDAAYDPVTSELVLSLSFKEPLRVDGAVVPVAPILPTAHDKTYSATTILRIRPDGTLSAVGQFENACIRHEPGLLPNLRVAAGGLYLRPSIRTVEDLAGCMPAENLGGLVVRIDEQPRVGP